LINSASASANGSFTISQANGFEVIKSVALRWVRRNATQPELVKVGPIVASGSYALVSWVYGETGGQVLLTRENGQWRVVTGGGGSLQNVDYLMQLGVPQKDAETLADGADV
jgi:SH3-like domain-containing protein